MTEARSSALYSPGLLGLAVELADHPLIPETPMQGRARSRTCGSEIVLSHNGTDTLGPIGLRVSACAVGQAAAAIFASEAHGKTRAALEQAEHEIDAWLKGTGALPEWPRFEQLVPALPHKGRHEAILLPWRAALDALSKGRGER